MEAKVTRRGFVKAVGAAAAGMAVLRAGTEIGLAPAHAESPHSEGGSRRQWAMVIDLRKCEGCITIGRAPQCTEGCSAAHFVPEGQQWIRVFRMEEGGRGSFFLPRLCNQCENAPCLNVCPVGATYRNPQGIILVDHNRCIGCRMCMSACPYGARSFNWGEPNNPPGATFAQYSPEYPVPHRRGVVEKCMLCAHRVEDGKIPACAQACPMGAIYLGDLVQDIATNGVKVVMLSRFLAENNAFRLKEELGTRPRVWYIHGHGQDFGHQSDDPRGIKEPRPWEQQR
ncbi:MAG: 4Fe-4S dicluster domain-containing protein [Chloroflexi bacterium]|nr:4Fe-4S dicluster domain-containing protein [Chloroflexota bacterium]